MAAGARAAAELHSRTPAVARLAATAETISRKRTPYPPLAVTVQSGEIPLPGCIWADRELRVAVSINVRRFSSSRVAVGRRQRTGNVIDEDLIRMATAHFEVQNLYEAVPVGDHDKEAPVLVVVRPARTRGESNVLGRGNG